MLKQIGLAAGMLVALLLMVPSQAEAQVRFGVTIGAPVYSYPVYPNYYYPYAYPHYRDPYYSYYSGYYAYPPPRYVVPVVPYPAFRNRGYYRSYPGTYRPQYRYRHRR